MSYNPTSAADDVSRWTSLGAKLPTDLTKAIETYQLVRGFDIDQQPVFAVSAVTPENADSMFKEFAEQVAMTATIVPNGASGVSVLAQAKRQALHTAARDVNNQAAEAVPALIDQQRDGFDQAASSFVEAVNNLPEKLSSQALVDAGPSVLAEYQKAQESASVIASTLVDYRSNQASRLRRVATGRSPDRAVADDQG